MNLCVKIKSPQNVRQLNLQLSGIYIGKCENIILKLYPTSIDLICNGVQLSLQRLNKGVYHYFSTSKYFAIFLLNWEYLREIFVKFKKYVLTPARFSFLEKVDHIDEQSS